MVEKLANFHIPRWEELPNIDLYLDQVVNFVEDNLSKFVSDDINEEQDDKSSKILTKTMINNYVKQGVLEAPIKKKYNKKHLACLFAICILKQVYSMSNINEIMNLYIKPEPVSKSYNCFCEEIEQSINLTFLGKEAIGNVELPTEKYILKNVAQSFASKLYVQTVFLSK